MERVLYLLYQPFAPAYDAVSSIVSRGHWQRWGEAVIPFLSGEKVLELGHGPGHLLATLSTEESGVVVGLDLSPQMGRIARERLLNAGLNARLIRGRGQALPLSPDTFDCVVAVFPAPYIVASETIQEIHRVLHRDGKLLIVPEAEFSDRGCLAGWIDLLYKVSGLRGHGVDDPNTSYQEWKRLFSEQGFRAVIHHIRLPESVVTIIEATKTVP